MEPQRLLAQTLQTLGWDGRDIQSQAAYMLRQHPINLPNTGAVTRIVALPYPDEYTRALEELKVKIARLIPFMELVGFTLPASKAIEIYNGLPTSNLDADGSYVIQGAVLTALGILSTENQQKEWIKSRLNWVLVRDEIYTEADKLADLIMDMPHPLDSELSDVFAVAREINGKGYLNVDDAATRDVDFRKIALGLTTQGTEALAAARLWFAAYLETVTTWEEYERVALRHYPTQLGSKDAFFLHDLLAHEVSAYLYKEMVVGLQSLFQTDPALV